MDRFSFAFSVVFTFFTMPALAEQHSVKAEDPKAQAKITEPNRPTDADALVRETLFYQSLNDRGAPYLKFTAGSIKPATKFEFTFNEKWIETVKKDAQKCQDDKRKSDEEKSKCRTELADSEKIAELMRNLSPQEKSRVYSRILNEVCTGQKRLFHDFAPQVRDYIVQFTVSVWEEGTATPPGLIACATSVEPYTGVWLDSLSALGDRKAPDAAKALIQALDSKHLLRNNPLSNKVDMFNTDRFRFAIRALVKMDSPEANDFLLKAVQAGKMNDVYNKHWDRNGLILAMAEFLPESRDARLIAPLKKHLVYNDRKEGKLADSRIGQVIAKIVEKTGNREGIEALTTQLDRFKYSRPYFLTRDVITPYSKGAMFLKADTTTDRNKLAETLEEGVQRLRTLQTHYRAKGDSLKHDRWKDSERKECDQAIKDVGEAIERLQTKAATLY